MANNTANLSVIMNPMTIIHLHISSGSLNDKKREIQYALDGETSFGHRSASQNTLVALPDACQI